MKVYIMLSVYPHRAKVEPYLLEVKTTEENRKEVYRGTIIAIATAEK